MESNQKKSKKIIAIIIAFLILMDCFIPGNIFGKNSSFPFLTAMANENSEVTTGSAIGGDISTYKIGEYVEGEYMSGEYAGVTSGSAISFMSMLFGANTNDVSNQITVEEFEIKIGDKVVFSGYDTATGPDLQIDSIEKFGFNFKWNAAKLKGSQLVGKDFTIQIGKFKGLALDGLNISEQVINIGVNPVGTHKLSYSTPDEEGYQTLSYTVKFYDDNNDFISLYNNVRGNFGGISTFKNPTFDTPIDLVFGTSGKGTITIAEVIEYPYPIGTGWGLEPTPIYAKTSILEKNGKTLINDFKPKWEVEFHDLIAKHQSGASLDSHKKFGNVIIEDTLDRHQKFDESYNGVLPFKIQVPVLYMYDKDSSETAISKIALDGKLQNLQTYTILSGREIAKNFTKVTDKGKYVSITENVEKTPCSWGIDTVVKGSANCEKLVINLGPMGDSAEPFVLPYTKNEIISKIDADIKTLQDGIEEIKTTSETEKWKTSITADLTGKWNAVYAKYDAEIKDDLLNIDEKIESVNKVIADVETKLSSETDADKKAKLQKNLAKYKKNLEILNKIKSGEVENDLGSFKTSVDDYIDVIINTTPTAVLAQGISFYGESPVSGDISFSQSLVEYSDFIDGEAPIAFSHEYQNFKASAKNFMVNFNKCVDNSFVVDREKLIAMYNNAKIFFENESTQNATGDNIYAYGFNMLYQTVLKEESVGKRDISNDVIIRTVGYSQSPTGPVNIDNSYVGGIQGDNRLGDVVLQKVDADTKKPMKGVNFEIYNKLNVGKALKFLSKDGGKYFEYDENGTVEKFATNAAGEIVLWGIPAKYLENVIEKDYEYVFKETTPSGYYEIDDVDFKPNYKQVTELKIKNYKRKAKLVKVDEEDTTKKLRGAEFKLYKDTDTSNPIKFRKEGNEYIEVTVSSSASTSTDVLITDYKGEITVAGLAAGTYYFMETKAPTGYYFVDSSSDTADNKYKFTLEQKMPKNSDGTTYKEDPTVVVKSTVSGSEVEYITNKRIPGKISLTKKGEGETEPLKNVAFELYKKINDGTYKQIETFDISTGKYTNKLEEGIQDALNTSTDATLKNALLTGKNGKITISGLEWGEYYLVEPWEKYTGTGTGNSTKGIIEPDSLKDYAYNATKYYFKIDAAAVGDALNEGKTENDTVEKVPACQKTAQLKIGSTTGAEVGNNEIINKKYVGSVRIEKYDETSTSIKLQNAVFELHKGKSTAHNNSCEKIGVTYKTSDNGIIDVYNLLPGDYHFVEKIAPRGYDIVASFGQTEQMVDFTISLMRGSDKKKQQNVIPTNGNVANTRKPGAITITKKGNSESGVMEVLSGTEFKLYQKIGSASTYTPVDKFNIDPSTITENIDKKYTYKIDENNLKIDGTTLVTDSNGKITVTSLPWGDYYLEESKASDYFTKNDTKYYFKIDANAFNPNTGDNSGTSITQLHESSINGSNLSGNTINNVRNYGTIQLIKYDKDRTATIDSEDVDVTKQYGTDYKGKEIDIVAVDGAVYNLYKLKDGETVCDINKDTLIKSDQNQKTKIYTPSQNGSGEYKTQADGKITVEKLYAGKYYFVEVKAPTGYKLNKTPVVFDIVKNNNKVGLISSNYFGMKFASNEKTKYIITLNKNDATTSVSLVNAEYELHIGAVHSDGCSRVSSDDVNVISGSKNGYSFTTDEKGQIKIEIKNSSTTPMAKYHFVEIKAPDRYHLNGVNNTGINEDVLNFEIAHDETSESNIETSIVHTNSKVTYGVELTKYDTTIDSKNIMKNVEFKLYKSDGTEIKNTATGGINNIWKTDANGKILVSNLEVGGYYFVETIPVGYRSPAENIEGYKIQTVNATSYGEIKYDATKRINFSIIQKNDAEKSDISNYNMKIDVTNERNAGVAILTKYANDNILGENNNPLKLLNGVTFNLYKQNGSVPDITNDTLIATKVTGGDNGDGKDGKFEDGKIVFKGLTWGNYYVKETKTTAEYVLNSIIHPTFNINEPTAEIPVDILAAKTTANPDGKIINEMCKANVKLIKTDGITKTPIEGAKFKLEPKSGFAMNYFAKFTDIYTTDVNGAIEVINLPLGEYCFKEISPKDGYYLNDSYKNGTASELNFYVRESDCGNTIILGDKDSNKVTNNQYDVQILKVSSEEKEPNKKLVGAKFWLYDSNKERIGNKEYETTAPEGKVSIGNLLSGKYYLKEVQAPKGYVLDEKYIEIVIPDIVEQKDKIISITVKNQRKPADATLKKVGQQFDNSLIPIEGATFELYMKNAKGVYEKQDDKISTTGKDGFLTFKDLVWGDYYVVEKNVPQNYMLDNSTQYSFSIDDVTTKNSTIGTININGTDSEGNINPIINLKYYGGVVLTKKSENDVLLKGVEFEFYKDGALVGKHMTDENGEIKISNLELGKYYFKETHTLDGYYIDSASEHIAFDITPSNANVDVPVKLNVKNMALDYDDEITKPTVPEVVPPVTPTEPPKPEIQPVIPPVVPEIQPVIPPVVPEIPEVPEGIEPPKNNVVVEETTMTEKEAEKEGVNNNNQIKVVKQDENGNGIGGVIYDLLDKNHNVVAKAVSDENGVVVFDNLDNDIYYLVEEEVSGGYLMPKEQMINFSGKAMVVTIKGNLSNMSIKIANLPYTAGSLVSTISLIIGGLILCLGVLQTIIKRKNKGKNEKA